MARHSITYADVLLRIACSLALSIMAQVRTLIIHYNNRQVQAVIELKNKWVVPNLLLLSIFFWTTYVRTKSWGSYTWHFVDQKTDL